MTLEKAVNHEEHEGNQLDFIVATTRLQGEATYSRNTPFFLVSFVVQMRIS